MNDRFATARPIRTVALRDSGWWNSAAATVILMAACAPTAAFAAEDARAWEFGISAYPTIVRDGENYTSAVATADHGALHLEARYNYESVGAGSAFFGWNFSGGDAVTWEVTPLIGGAWGTTRAVIPGLEATVAWKGFDGYVEAEYVRDISAVEDSYFFAWTELGYRPFEWLRFGLAGQRTRAYDNDRDIQRGPFVQLSWRQVTIGGYWFNPGSSSQVFVGLVSATF